MKNIRRPPKAHGQNNEVSSESSDSARDVNPPRKRRKIQKENEMEDSSMDDEEYAQLLQQIKEENEKNHTTKVYMSL